MVNEARPVSRREVIRAAVGAAAMAQGGRAMAAESEPAIEVAAYYFPNYHPDRRNDAWHGKGWTEWDVVKAARPRYPGHRQPVVPEWGYFDESDPKWTAKEIDLAADHGITTFIYDWYWYEDGPYLEDGLEKGFLQAPNNPRLKFGLMWANHDWLNIHPAPFVNHPETLAKGRVSAAGWDRLTDHVVRTYFPRPNYWKLDGEPYFSIYEWKTFVDGLGGEEAARAALERFRAKTRAAGFPGLHLNVSAWGVPKELDLKAWGIASAGTYAWIHHFDPNRIGFPKSSYVKAAERNYEVWRELTARFPVPYHPNVSMGWDSSPRTIQSDVYENRGYPWTAIMEGNTPAAFREALAKAKEFLRRPEVKQRVLVLNAWNEWTEGSYLLPDTVHGTAYLKAIREVFGVRRG
jgi:hypothetical protein